MIKDATARGAIPAPGTGRLRMQVCSGVLHGPVERIRAGREPSCGQP
jgi:hypothetical protein